MVESHLQGRRRTRQDLVPGTRARVRQSITDGCIDWDELGGSTGKPGSGRGGAPQAAAGGVAARALGYFNTPSRVATSNIKRQRCILRIVEAGHAGAAAIGGHAHIHDVIRRRSPPRHPVGRPAGPGASPLPARRQWCWPRRVSARRSSGPGR